MESDWMWGYEKTALNLCCIFLGWGLQVDIKDLTFLVFTWGKIQNNAIPHQGTFSSSISCRLTALHCIVPLGFMFFNHPF